MKERGIFSNLLHKFDFFGEDVPGFNLRGKKKVTTSMGACASVVMIILTLLFALLKLKHLLGNTNPIIITNTVAVNEGEIF